MAYNYVDYQSKIIAPQAAGVALTARGNSIIHPLFGIQVTTDAGSNIYSAATTLQEYEDFLPREIGLSSEIIKNNKILTALATPGDYLLAKNTALAQIGTDLVVPYRNEYVKQYNLGKSNEEAKRIAIRYVEAIKQQKLLEHEQDFPTSLTEKVIGKLDRKNMTGNF